MTYFIDTRAKVITLTTFRKQRQSERREVARARQAMRANIAYTAARSRFGLVHEWRIHRPAQPDGVALNHPP